MGAKFKPEDLTFEKLTENNAGHIDSFTNQETELVAFLKEDALKNQKSGVSVTYLVFVQEGGKKLVGYITLLSDAVEVRQNKELTEAFEHKGIRYKTLPALKIGRMATDMRYQSRNVGKEMIKFAIATALVTSRNVGCRFLIVDTKGSANNFYIKNGFKELKETTTYPKPLYFDLYLPPK